MRTTRFALGQGEQLLANCWYWRSMYQMESPANLNKQRILDYLRACYAGDVDRAASCLDDEVDFIAYAPIEIFPTLGQKLGKAAMTKSIAGLHTRYQKIDYEVITIIAEDDRVAVMLDLHLQVRDSDRIVRLQIANFCTLRDGRITIYRQFLDSFDAVQQKFQRDLVAAMQERM